MCIRKHKLSRRLLDHSTISMITAVLDRRVPKVPRAKDPSDSYWHFCPEVGSKGGERQRHHRRVTVVETGTIREFDDEVFGPTQGRRLLPSQSRYVTWQMRLRRSVIMTIRFMIDVWYFHAIARRTCSHLAVCARPVKEIDETAKPRLERPQKWDGKAETWGQQ